MWLKKLHGRIAVLHQGIVATAGGAYCPGAIKINLTQIHVRITLRTHHDFYRKISSFNGTARAAGWKSEKSNTPKYRIVLVSHPSSGFKRWRIQKTLLPTRTTYSVSSHERAVVTETGPEAPRWLSVCGYALDNHQVATATKSK
jgi:hypothetical protein